MPSFKHAADARSRTFANLAERIGRELAAAYAREHDAGRATQASLGDKLGVDRSVVHRRLLGDANMTIRSLADMIWALDQDFSFHIAPRKAGQNAAPVTAEPSAPTVKTSTNLGVAQMSSAIDLAKLALVDK